MFDTTAMLGTLPPSPRPLRVEALTLVSGGKTLLHQIDLTISTNARTCIMGFNGAGKTLLLRCLHGMISPTSGRIYWDGRPMDDSCRGEQAMVFQKPVLLRRSVLENINFATRVLGNSAIQTRDDLLEELDLAHLRHKPAQVLSGGEQQRLALARALVVNPKVLFLDEATANLDPITVGLFEKCVIKAQARGTKIIFVSHNIKQAKRLAQEIVFLHDGKITEASPALQFFSDPASAQAQAYLDGEPVS